MPQAEHAPTTGPNLPSRRAFLAGFAKSVPLALAAGTVTVGATAATMIPADIAEFGEPLPPVDVELVALGEGLDTAIVDYLQARQEKREARARFDAIAPSLPDDLVMREPHWSPRWIRCEPERDIENDWILPEGRARGRLVVTSGDILDAMPDVDKRTVRGRLLKRLLPIAEAYERERDLAAHQSGLTPALDRVYWTSEVIAGLARRIAPLRPHSLAGLVVKAKAMNAVHAMPTAINYWPRLAEDVMQLGGVGSYWVRQPDGGLRFAREE